MRHSNYRALLWLGIPIVIGQIGVIILGFADTLMIGHHSTHELAAASFVNNMLQFSDYFQYGFQLWSDSYRGQSVRTKPL